MGFTCQVKIPFIEDPVIGIFKALIETYLHNRKESNLNDYKFRYAFIKINCYLELLSVNKLSSLDQAIDQFNRDLAYKGVWSSFKIFLFKLNVSNSNYSNNISILKKTCSLANGDIERIFLLLEKAKDQKYSTDFRFGKECEKIQIMTAHASKGLEFDHVLLGGIHTNGRKQTSNFLMGKMPGSFKWKKGPGEKKSYKSPQFILEVQQRAVKDFSESKRLFYVACTRAQKTLTWINVRCQNKDQFFSEDSWINGVRAWENNFLQANDVNIENLSINQDYEVLQSSFLNKNVKIPLFHKDNLGLVQKNNETSKQLLTLPELSVTRLSSIFRMFKEVLFTKYYGLR